MTFDFFISQVGFSTAFRKHGGSLTFPKLRTLHIRNVGNNRDPFYNDESKESERRGRGFNKARAQ